MLGLAKVKKKTNKREIIIIIKRNNKKKREKRQITLSSHTPDPQKNIID